jgi:hypothetical protein
MTEIRHILYRGGWPDVSSRDVADPNIRWHLLGGTTAPPYRFTDGHAVWEAGDPPPCTGRCFPEESPSMADLLGNILDRLAALEAREEKP